ncbi:hypothetical protein [Colwellia sp. PAMC 21821]|uniref:hypothetical protein n=1 Tax=Colwellia sp. PAMC 21821 TaxID=1816219 RepID=UPI0009BFC41F|nr:hypothetical protein [Colwellia sp. PAMC 21821]ARD43585.1 hypothetical protein A3Q33_04230 [Colwellia sp. PAMC 21821]
MIFLDKSEDKYSFKEFFIVLSCIVLSKSLYFETYGNNLLLGAFLAFLAFTVKPSKLKINRNILFYTITFILLIGINVETKVSSSVVLLLRIFIAIYVVHILDFRKFSIVYTKIILFISMISLFSFFIIYLNIPSLLPDFIGTDERPLRNFLFFGVPDNFVKYDIYRNSGLWWEPGAFQLFINIAFMFTLINHMMTKKLYVLFGIAIISTLSTTGVLVYILLSSIYWREVIRNSNNKLLYILVVSLLSVIVVIIAVPFLLIKFGAGNIAEESVSFLSRYYDFIISFNMLKDNLFLGYGYGSQIENAIPYGIQLMGISKYELINPTGSDGLTMFIAQCGIFSLIFLFPFLFPKYGQTQNIINRTLIAISLIIMFNTENFTFLLIFSLLTFYGIIGDKKRQPNQTVIKKI